MSCSEISGNVPEESINLRPLSDLFAPSDGTCSCCMSSQVNRPMETQRASHHLSFKCLAGISDFAPLTAIAKLFKTTSAPAIQGFNFFFFNLQLFCFHSIISSETRSLKISVHKNPSKVVTRQVYRGKVQVLTVGCACRGVGTPGDSRCGLFFCSM